MVIIDIFRTSTVIFDIFIQIFAPHKNGGATMVWTCGACTYENASESATSCEICATVRSGMENSVVGLTVAPQRGRKEIDKKSRKQMKQRNLYGTVIGTPSVFKSRKRKDPPGATKTSAFVEAARAAAESNSNADTRDRRPSKFVESARAASVFAVEVPNDNAKRKADTARHPLMMRQDVRQQVVQNVAFPTLWEKAMRNMKDIFGVESLRNLQPAAVECALKRQSQIIVLATGGGKSLCYQLPATVLGGVTIVISPLIALMVDQVQALNDKGVSAALVSSANGARANNEVLERLLGRPLKAQKKMSKKPLNLKPITVLYGTPELCQTQRFRNVLFELYQQNRIATFAVDEAHCLSTWGHDFRPAYRSLAFLRTNFPDIPVTACTATATAHVIEDIRNVLLLKPGQVPCHMGSFNRPNVSYQVRFKQSLDATKVQGAMSDLIKLVQDQHAAAVKESRPCSGIIYVHKRQDCETLAKEITKKTGIHAAAYHGGLKDAQRSEVQREWTRGSIQVAVATIAFGMGIDLGHVRYVVHWSLAKTVEGFYQESGRAGRDGRPAISVLYFSKDEASKFSYLIQKQNSSSKDPEGNKMSMERSLDALQRMVSYCVTPCCRRKYLLEHFGETIDPAQVCKDTCDYCQNPKQVEQRIEASKVVQDVVNFRHGHTSGGKKSSSPTKWDGQWSKPHGEDDEGEDEWQDVWIEGDLRIASSVGEGMFEEVAAPFSSANDASILDKYEAMEDREKNGDFVHFKSNSASSSKPQIVSIPEHLRENLPDPLAHLTKKKPAAPATTTKTGDSSRLKAELAKLKAQREQTALRLKELAARTKASSARLPPPPPSLASLGTNKKKKTR